MEKFKVIGAIALLFLSSISCKKRYDHIYDLTINCYSLLDGSHIPGVKWTVKEYKTDPNGIFKATTAPTSWEMNGVTNSYEATKIFIKRRNNIRYEHVITIDPTSVVAPAGTFYNNYKIIGYPLNAGTGGETKTFDIGFLPSMNTRTHIKNINCQGVTDSLSRRSLVNISANPQEDLNNVPYTGYVSSFAGCTDFLSIYSIREIGKYIWQYKVKRGGVETFHSDTIIIAPGVNDVIGLFY